MSAWVQLLFMLGAGVSPPSSTVDVASTESAAEAPAPNQDNSDHVRRSARVSDSEHQFDLGLTLSAGAGLCHILVAPCGVNIGAAVAIPYLTFGPGIGLRGRYRYRLNERWGVKVAGNFSIGGFKEGSMLGQLGSYGASLGVDFVWFDAQWISFIIEPHFGVRSISLFPLPLVGVTHEVSVDPLFIFAREWEQEWVRWTIDAGLTTDLLVVVPAPRIYAQTGFLVRVFGVYVGAEGRVAAEAKIAVFANSIGAEAAFRVLAGYAF